IRQLHRDDSFEEAFDHLFARAERVAFRLLGNAAAAEDVAAETLMRTFADWPRVRNLEYRDAWVLRVATNLAIDACRRRKLPVQLAAAASEEDVIALGLTLAAALSSLPRRQRDAVALHYLSGFSDEEVAQALGIAVGTVKTHIHRGMEALRRALGDDFGGMALAT